MESKMSNKETLEEWYEKKLKRFRWSPRYWWEYWKLRFEEWRYRRWWKRECPELFYTFDWDEHPEDWDEPCICSECRSLMASDG
jgi:hypothetical protein